MHGGVFSHELNVLSVVNMRLTFLGQADEMLVVDDLVRQYVMKNRRNLIRIMNIKLPSALTTKAGFCDI